MWFIVLNWMLIAIVSLIIVYSIRHYLFTLVRTYVPAHDLYCDICDAEWPRVVVQIAAHNEEAVIADCIEALLAVDYPPDKLFLMPVNDRSTDRTREIIDHYVALHPGRIRPFHRTSGKPGKAAALKDALELIGTEEILVVFDADYLPSTGLIKRLVAPFFDPEIGATMGRVVPVNAGRNLLTRLLEIERCGGYQVDQQARQQLGLVPQYGGTTGGVRLHALRAVGGWRDDMLAEDTDLTYRLLLAGWRTAYQNRAECYEEVPETWRVRIRQIKRWAKGHNQVMVRNLGGVLSSPLLNWRSRLDAVLLLGVYAMAPVLLLGWIVVVALFYVGQTAFSSLTLVVMLVFTYGALGNFAAFYEMAAGLHFDRRYHTSRLLPLTMLSFLVSMMAISSSIVSFLIDWIFRRDLKWDKTARFRTS